MKQETTVTIDGARVALAFGTRFDVRYGKDDTVLRDALLEGRAANGDLIFRVVVDADPPSETIRRVRPSTIDALFGSGVEATGPALARAKAEDAIEDPVGIGSDTIRICRVDLEAFDQEDPVAAAFHDHPDAAELAADAGRIAGDFGLDDGPADGENAAAFLARAEATLGAAYSEWIGSDAGQAALAAAAAEAKAARPKRTRTGGTIAVDPVSGSVSGTSAGLAKAKRTARPYAERNQVWRCGTCKRRTRVAICTGPATAPHDPVAAPAGKRREAREVAG